MGKKITVITRPGTRIAVNSSKQESKQVTVIGSGHIAINAPQRDYVKEINVVGAGKQGDIDRLRKLKDVDATSLDNNETLVYDEVSGKFVVREIPIINGGTF